MSIILEALKKTGKKDLAETTGIKQAYETPGLKLKDLETQTPHLNLPGLSKSALISLAIIAVGGLLFFYFLGENDIPVAEKTVPQAQPTNFALTEKPEPGAGAALFPREKQAEGYAPVDIFKIKALDSRLTLNGIVSGIGKPAAIIDNKIVEEGASINSSKVMKIYSDKVELRNELSGEIYTLQVY